MPPNFDHIPQRMRIQYSEAWSRLEQPRCADDKERELALLEVIDTDHYLLDMLREDAGVTRYQVGRMDLDDDFTESHQLTDRILRLRKDQLDKDQTYTPEESLTNEVNKEHRELLGKY